MLHCISTFLIALLQKYFSDCRVPSSIRFPPALVAVLLHASELFCCLAAHEHALLLKSCSDRSLGWGIFSLFFKQNAREPGTMWCFGCRLVFYKVLYTLLYCGPLSLFQMGWWYAIAMFSTDWMSLHLIWSMRLHLCTLCAQRMWLMSHLCFVCAPHVPAW